MKTKILSFFKIAIFVFLSIAIFSLFLTIFAVPNPTQEIFYRNYEDSFYITSGFALGFFILGKFLD